MSESGIASRRDAEKLIEQGKVSINGKTIKSPVNFVSENDVVKVDGKIISNIRNESFLNGTADGKPDIYLFHKPVGCIVSKHDPEGRKTIYDILPEKYRNLKYIGRLDYNTSGLLLMTNNGDLARELTLPESNIERVYIAKIGGAMTMDDTMLNRLLKPVKKGIKINGIIYRPMKIERLSANDIKIKITEGKKNEIRKVFDHIGLPVRALHRISYGKYELGDLPSSKVIKL